ncbi:unnamed protein product [Prunus armeniaca]
MAMPILVDGLKGGLAAGPGHPGWNSGHSCLMILPELHVDLPLHHGCHVVQSILAPLCYGLLSEHNFLYLIQPPGASPGTSTSGIVMG